MRQQRFVIVLVLAVVAVCGREGRAADVGVAAALTRSTLGSDGLAGTGFRVSAFADVALGARFDFQPEIAFARKVTVTELGDGVSVIRSTLTSDYMEVPLLFRRAFGGPGRVTPFLIGGGYLGWLARARDKQEIGGEAFEADAKPGLESWDGGLVAGGGVEVRSGAVRLVFDVRYNQGLVSIIDAPASRTRTLAFSGGVKW